MQNGRALVLLDSGFRRRAGQRPDPVGGPGMTVTLARNIQLLMTLLSRSHSRLQRSLAPTKKKPGHLPGLSQFDANV
jgi:hypothetical protein